jgi:hypothetical protein
MHEEASVRSSLEIFFQNNPGSSLEPLNLGEETRLVVTKPWGDSSLVLEIPTGDYSDFASSLNALKLPERLSAIYHIDSGALEVIWTAYQLNSSNSDLRDRKFDFIHEGKTYPCHFRSASDRLLTLAETWNSVSPSETSYRNLGSFRSYMAVRDHLPDQDSPFGEPTCFWVEGLDLTDDQLVSFLHHLNFYLGYFDDLSPLVVIHPPQFKRNAAGAQIRYRHGNYPATIAAKEIEPEVLHFWAAAHTGGPVDQFLHAYRIIEHAAFFYVDSETTATVRKVLLAPHALDNVHIATDRVIEAVRASAIQDYAKMEHVMVACVAAHLLWPAVEAHIDYFSKPQSFDGGFELKPLVANINSRDEFLNSGVKNVFHAARNVRNALSHGKESRTASVIVPTKSNQEKLRPWALLMRKAAGEVVVYNVS